MIKSYLRTSGLLFNQPLMVTPDMLDNAVRWANQVMNLNIINLPGTDLQTQRAQPAMVGGDVGASGAGKPASGQGLRVLPVHGLLVSRGAHVDLCETMTSYEGLRNQLQAAIDDPMVERIALDIDTPGGSATGAFEFAADLRGMAQIKPITAIVNFTAHSAGYLIAAACSEIVVSRTSSVGSVGVIAKHMDRSEMEAKAGVKVTTVYAGAHKNDLSPHEPLSEQSYKLLQSLVDDSYQMFTEAIAEYRGMTVQAVRATEAAVYRGQAAIDVGLADRLQTPQEAVNSLAQSVAKPVSSSRISVRARAADIAAQI